MLVAAELRFRTSYTQTEDLDEKRALQEMFRKFLDLADAKLEKISDRLGIVKAAQLDDARKAAALVGLVIRNEGITQEISRDWSIDYTCHAVRPCSYRGSSVSKPAAAINFEGMTFPGFFFEVPCLLRHVSLSVDCFLFLSGAPVRHLAIQICRRQMWTRSLRRRQCPRLRNRRFDETNPLWTCLDFC
ncbi:hypothetical protein AK812_SmicGene45745, partial [Symbiodinium microadriaticum]